MCINPLHAICSLLICAAVSASETLPVELSALPESPLRAQLTAMPADVRAFALSEIQRLAIPARDLTSIRASSRGNLYYVCPRPPRGPLTQPGVRVAHGASAASVPISRPPVYHSKLGAPYRIYLDFNGGTVTTPGWTNGGPALKPLPWSLDADRTTFSDEEQAAIYRIWQRVSEDYAPFNIDVTTDANADPDRTGGSNNVGWIVITETTDANGVELPHFGAGGVAFLDVFGSPSYYLNSQPAWVTGDMREDYVAEAASHEMGHNLGLEHDGDTNGDEYYLGHGSGATSWGPIMGAGYDMEMTQWSRGQYFHANNTTQDDLAIITAKVPYRTDDHGNTDATATALATAGTTILDGATTASNRGIIERTGDVDAFSFVCAAGSINIQVSTNNVDTYTKGANLDVKLELYSSTGALLTSASPSSSSSANIIYNGAGGTYFLHVTSTGFGNPAIDPPTGYTNYGSIGQYWISGTYPGTLSGPVITSPLTAVGYLGQAFTYTITSSAAASAFTAVGLPTGLAVSPSTGVISGTPEQSGIFNVTITADTAAAVLLLTINELPPTLFPTITSPDIAQGQPGATFTYQIIATNEPSQYASTTLPAGLSISGQTGLISGIPLANGTTVVTLTAANAFGAGTKNLRIVIGPIINNPDNPTSSSSSSSDNSEKRCGFASLIGVGIVAMALTLVRLRRRGSA